MPRPIPNDILQSLGLHLVNINGYAKFYQNIPNGLRVIDNFHEQAGVKIFTNCPVTKSMFDYRALYEIQLQVSVDFLRVMQFTFSNSQIMYMLDCRQILRTVLYSCILYC